MLPMTTVGNKGRWWINDEYHYQRVDMNFVKLNRMLFPWLFTLGCIYVARTVLPEQALHSSFYDQPRLLRRVKRRI